MKKRYLIINVQELLRLMLVVCGSDDGMSVFSLSNSSWCATASAAMSLREDRPSPVSPMGGEGYVSKRMKEREKM